MDQIKPGILTVSLENSMFTGIITDLAVFEEVKDDSYYFSVKTELVKKVALGSSIAINGVCLTVAILEAEKFAVQLTPETTQKTTLKSLKKMDVVNVELPTQLSQRLEGHIVQGHVDGLARVEHIEEKGNSHVLKIAIPAELSPYIVNKGSIALNGISFTVAARTDTLLSISVIPYTWTNTMVHYLVVGDYVNLEVDIIAKYIERLVKPYNCN